MARRRDRNSGDGTRPTRRVERVAQRTQRLLDNRADRDMLLMRNAIRDLESRVVTQVNKLRTSDVGLLLGPRVNLKQAQRIHRDLTEAFDDTYGRSARRVVRGYRDADDWVLRSFRDLDVAAGFTAVETAMLSELRSAALMGFNSVAAASEARITQALYNTVAAGAPFSRLVEEVRMSLTGTRDQRGRSLSQNAEMYANDGIMNYYNSASTEKGRQLGMKHMLYVGNIMNTTREFCRKRVGKVYTVAQINSWTHKWQGKSGPALSHRGGYNCRHHWQPVRKEWVKDKK